MTADVTNEQQHREYSLEDVSEHNTADSLWIVYEDKVLDITRFTDEHPGGDEVLLEVAGQDGTSKFIDADHSKDAVEMIDQYVIGRLTESDRERLESARKRSSAGNNTRRIQLLCALGAGVILIGAFVVYRYIRK